MEFFSNHWLLWTAVFLPSALWVVAEKARGTTSRTGDVARIAAGVSGIMLAFAAIHVIVESAVGLLFS